jgi:SAM-dependent methyltransferase
MDPTLLSRLGHVVPYAQDDPVLPPVGTPADVLPLDGPNLKAWLFWMSDVLEKDGAGRRERVLRDAYPLPDVVNREGYSSDDHLAFWMSGFADYLKTLETVAPYGCTGGRIYDFGGGTGRVFRHFAAQSDAWEVWTSDFRLSSVQWNLAHYPPAILAFANTSAPALPLPDSCFDLVTAYSVFTHIAETETQWLLELRRILKVGGIAYLSFHDEGAWESEGLRRMGTQSLGLPLDAPMPPGKTVARWREDDPYNCNVFHAADHIERVWGRYFDILQIRPRWVGAQAVAVCRRPS